MSTKTETIEMTVRVPREAAIKLLIDLLEKDKLAIDKAIGLVHEGEFVDASRNLPSFHAAFECLRKLDSKSWLSMF